MRNGTSLWIKLRSGNFFLSFLWFERLSWQANCCFIWKQKIKEFCTRSLLVSASENTRIVMVMHRHMNRKILKSKKSKEIIDGRQFWTSDSDSASNFAPDWWDQIWNLENLWRCAHAHGSHEHRWVRSTLRINLSVTVSSRHDSKSPEQAKTKSFRIWDFIPLFWSKFWCWIRIWCRKLYDFIHFLNFTIFRFMAPCALREWAKMLILLPANIG